MQLDTGNNGMWPTQISANEMTARQASGFSHMTNQQAFQSTFQNRHGSLANQVVNLLTTGDWACLYNA